MNYGGHFEPEKKQKRINELNNKMLEPNFWDNKKQSEQIINELTLLKDSLQKTGTLRDEVTNYLEILKELNSVTDEDLKKLCEEEIKPIGDRLNKLEVTLLLNGPYDQNDTILEIHSGAGGTEACDWASMLKRMYLRWCEIKGYHTDVIDELEGDEAGFKSVTIIVKGVNAYGYLKNEKGVHRLIRLSPFNANNKRQTSFASVEVEPIFDNNDISIEIKDSDLRIDVYRSSGKGGQGVNTTDSAVRITHLPTNIVVTCQNERSQIQNKETALGVLKSKLYKLEIDKREVQLQNIKGSQMGINFGSQIRTYTLHPYSLVKDHRTNTEVTNVNKVLDGDIDIFIDNNLKKKDK